MGYYTKHGIIVGRAFHPYSQRYFRQMQTQVSFHRAFALDRFVKDLIRIGVYSRLDYLVWHKLQTEQQGLVSLTAGNPVLLKLGTPTFGAGVGFTGTGSNASRLDTPANYDTFTNFLQNSAMFGGLLTSTPATNTVAMGTPNQLNSMAPNYLGAHKYGRINMASNNGEAYGGGGPGLQIIDRNAAASLTYYKDGVSHGVNTVSSSPRAALPFSILNMNSSVPGSNTHALSVIGGSLTPTEHAAFNTAVNTCSAALTAAP